VAGQTPATAGYVSVVVVHPSLSHLNKVLTYAVPEGADVVVGSLVRVPIRGKSRHAVVVATLDAPDVERTVAIRAVLGPGLPADVVDLARWTAGRYLSTLGEAMAAALPERVASEEKQSPRTAGDPGAAVPPEALTGARNGRAMLHAITVGEAGSFVWRPRADEDRGDTIAALAAGALARGAGVLVLVPEVRVSGEVLDALRDRFGGDAAWLSSDRTARMRYRDWLALRHGAKRLAIGARAAVFAPVQDLGLIIVDDEGHQAYKEGRAPRFHARAVAAERASAAGASIVLVGMPPSIEARAAVQSRAFRSVTPARQDELRARPPVAIVERGPEERVVPAGRTVNAARRAHREGRRVVVLTHRAGEDAVLVARRMARALEARTPATLDATADGALLASAAARADLIVATPFVAKDLRVEGAGMLVIVEADAALSQPEFRAQEDAFATWWHAARWAAGGRIVLETKDPRQPAIAALIRWDPEVLWRAEAAKRREIGYPPFAALARIDTPADRAGDVAALLAEDGRLEVLGPVERQERWVVVARARRREVLLDALAPIVERWREAGEPMRVDVDPREVFVPKWRSSRSGRSATRS